MTSDLPAAIDGQWIGSSRQVQNDDCEDAAAP